MAQALSERDAGFLSEPRIAVLMTTTRDSQPLGVPVWFHWNGETLDRFTSRLGCTSVHLDVYRDNPAVALYLRQGFRVVVETDFPRKHGLPAHLRMIREPQGRHGRSTA